MCLFYATAMWNQFFNALMFLQDDSKDASSGRSSKLGT